MPEREPRVPSPEGIDEEWQEICKVPHIAIELKTIEGELSIYPAADEIYFEKNVPLNEIIRILDETEKREEEKHRDTIRRIGLARKAVQERLEKGKN